ncbi:N-formylmaleamate deformylase [Nonomuraea muscovyensis]|uniref:N-formylmaleamate deformylase n=1 Tax=Nonomuraea muscovyensis TaxID=1124761 RepID=A0A7X0C8L4_9ACTN|nr:alpha/beta hydrolase [Nonomuraea muscovyensis]MBB6350560.1 N-formylmaleamate deformylase [Nonomuraea muscovyensis]
MSDRVPTHVPAHVPTRVLTQPALADLADVPARSRWVRSGPLRLHVLDYGGDGVPVLVLPGITSPAIAMDFVARELTDLVRPVVLDVRGRGLSDDGPSYTLEDYAADTEAVVTELGLDGAVLLGHSMGARIAGLTAARGRVALGGTVLVDPPMSGPGRGPYPTTLEAFRGQLGQARRGTDADEVAASWPRWPRREQELRARWLASCGDVAVAETHRGFESEDFFTFWPSVPAPTVLVYGADSPVVTAEGVTEAAAANPGARLLEVPAAGHMVFWDNPEAALEAVRAVLRG